MHRENLRKKLEEYHPTDAEEINDKRKMLDFLNEHENCFDRSLKIGHFTGTCWLENYDGTKFLLTLHKKIGLWLTLGGHADGCGNLSNVALKEAYEESGLRHIRLLSDDIFDIDIHKIEEYHGIPTHYHYDVRFLLKTTDRNDDIRISNESDDLRWFSEPPTDFSNLGSDIPRMFVKWKTLKNQ